MDKFQIPRGGKDEDSINRTIRWRGNIYDMLMELSDKHKVSFNRLVNDAVQFALERLDENNERQ
ncbi:MAG: hypothetical protein FWC80_03300 [Firmicutes bacterium]|nr:hypothetical protein [Bacillota bacterium]